MCVCWPAKFSLSLCVSLCVWGRGISFAPVKRVGSIYWLIKEQCFTLHWAGEPCGSSSHWCSLLFLGNSKAGSHHHHGKTDKLAAQTLQVTLFVFLKLMYVFLSSNLSFVLKLLLTLGHAHWNPPKVAKKPPHKHCAHNGHVEGSSGNVLDDTQTLCYSWASTLWNICQDWQPNSGYLCCDRSSSPPLSG